MYEEDNGLENEELTSKEEQDNNANDLYENEQQQPINSTNDIVHTSQQAVSIFKKIILLFNKLPLPIRGTLLTASFYILMIILVLILIFMASGAATGVSEELFSGLQGVGESVETFFEKAGNFFTDNKFVTDEDMASKLEEEYYQKLNDVYEEYKQKLGVNIDTTLITATLFYGRGMSGYLDEEAIYEDENEDDEDIYKEMKKFYKVAKRHIKTLAKFQIVENSSYNACYSRKLTNIIPSSEKEIADTWTGFFGYNTRATFNYQLYNEVSYPMIDGTARNITWCEFDDAETLLTKHYKDDYNLYKKVKEEYDTCVRTCEADDCSDNKTASNTGGVHTYPSKDNNCTPCNVETHCAEKKEKKDEYYQKLQDNWGDLFNSSGVFQCGHSSTWGDLSRYDEPQYLNYNFNKELINEYTVPSELDTLIQGVKNMLNFTPNCSAKPSIILNYYLSIGRESVYYYKLLSRETELLGNKSFIEKYYTDYIDSSDEDQAAKDALEIVDGIYDMYEYIIEDRVYCSNSIGTGYNYSSESTEEFISMIAPSVVDDMKNTNVLSSVTIAQAILESGNGKSELASKYGNYYGQTAGSCTKGMDTNLKGPITPGTNGNNCIGNEFWDGTVVRMCNKNGNDCQWYRVYSGFENSTLDHSENFLKKNFSYCNSYLNDAHRYVSCLVEREDHKYATDPDYVNKIMNVINSNDLLQYDIGTSNSSVQQVERPIVGSGITTEDNIDLSSYAQNCIPLSNTTGVGTITGVSGQNIRTSLWGTSEYTTFWGSDNNLFYRSNRALVKECTWYAHGRGLEILTSNGMSLETAQKYMDPMHGNAGRWYSLNRYFSSSTDYMQPKVGAIIVWSNGSKPGHVAIIEDIKYDSSGNVISITTTEGGQSINGFKYTEGRSLNYIKAHGTYRFVGYIYLLN